MAPHPQIPAEPLVCQRRLDRLGALIAPCDYLLRQSDRSVLLPDAQRRVSRPPQDLEPLESELPRCRIDGIPDLQRAFVVQPRLARRVQALGRDAGGDRRGQSCRQLARRVPMVGKLRSNGRLRRHEPGLLADRSGQPQMQTPPLSCQEVGIDRLSHQRMPK